MSAAADPNLYFNSSVGFEVRKPRHWIFLATPWAIHLRRKNILSSDELQQIIDQAAAPFVYAHLPHEELHSPFPTLQAACRVLAAHLTPKELLPDLISQLERQFGDFHLLESTARAIVGGRQATLIKARFTLENREGARFGCLSRSYTIFAHPLVYTVGLSCAAQGAYCVEDDIESIVRSIRIRG